MLKQRLIEMIFKRVVSVKIRLKLRLLLRVILKMVAGDAHLSIALYICHPFKNSTGVGIKKPSTYNLNKLK